LQAYDQVLSLASSSPNRYHVAWYHKEIGAYWWARLDRPFSGFNPDAELDPQLKEGWCKGYVSPHICGRRWQTGEKKPRRSPHAFAVKLTAVNLSVVQA
jgi:hypothetical protein